MTALATERPRLIPVEEAARLLGIGRSTTYDLIRSGQLRSVKIGKRRLVPAFAVDEAIERLSQESS
jgi:excisionase family DNA binding protein